MCNDFLRKMWCGHEDAWDNFGFEPVLLTFSNAKGLGAGLRRHFSHALVDLEVWCTLSCGITLFPYVLQSVETFGNHWNSIWNSCLFFCASTVFRSVWWLMGGGILSTTTPWRVWRWSFGKCATALWHRHKSEVGKDAQSFETFCHILICPDNFDICATFIHFSRISFCPLPKACLLGTGHSLHLRKQRFRNDPKRGTAESYFTAKLTLRSSRPFMDLHHLVFGDVLVYLPDMCSLFF